MIALSGEPALQVQVGEAIAIMAEADFPDQWQNLVDVRDFSSAFSSAVSSCASLTLLLHSN